MAEDKGRVYDWDDVIEEDGDEFVLLPAGDYNFTIHKVEKGQYNGGENIPACPKVDIHLLVESDKGNAYVRHTLFMHSKMERMLSNFFIGVGRKKKGKPFKMDFKNLEGVSGKAKVGIREYKGKQYNEIKRFYAPEEYLKQYDEKEEDDLDW